MVSELWDKKIESMPLKELKDLQLKRLKQLVKRVYEKNKFYKQKLDESNVKPNDIKQLSDIEKLPF